MAVWTLLESNVVGEQTMSNKRICSVRRGAPPSHPSLILPLIVMILLAFPSLPPDRLWSIHPTQASYKDQAENNGGGIGLYIPTRRECVMDFIAALQMDDGGFVDELNWPRSSKSVCGVYRAAETLSAIGGLEAIDREKAITYTASCQLEEGSFELDPGEECQDTLTTRSALVALMHLGGLDAIDREAAAAWVLSCQEEDGRFRMHPDISGTSIWIIHNALWSLEVLGALNRLRYPMLDHLLTYIAPEGGFSFGPNEGEALDICTMSGVYAFTVLGYEEYLPHNITDYIMSFYDNETGSFKGSVRLTYFFVSSLDMLGRLDLVDADRVASFILSCQSPLHGGFVNRPEWIYEQDREGIMPTHEAVQVLAILGRVDLLDEVFSRLEPPVWTGGEDGDATTGDENNGGTGGVPPLSSWFIFLFFIIGTPTVVAFSLYFLVENERRRRKREKRRARTALKRRKRRR